MGRFPPFFTHTPYSNISGLIFLQNCLFSGDTALRLLSVLLACCMRDKALGGFFTPSVCDLTVLGRLHPFLDGRPRLCFCLCLCGYLSFSFCFLSGIAVSSLLSLAICVLLKSELAHRFYISTEKRKYKKFVFIWVSAGPSNQNGFRNGGGGDSQVWLNLILFLSWFLCVCIAPVWRV